MGCKKQRKMKLFIALCLILSLCVCGADSTCGYEVCHFDSKINIYQLTYSCTNFASITVLEQRGHRVLAAFDECTE